MPTIEFEGETHVFPDDFTDADIAKALGTKPPGPPNAGLAPAAGGTPPLALNPNFKYDPERPGSGEIGGGPDIMTALKNAARGPAMGAAAAAPIMSAGASVPVQAAVMGASGAAQSKLQGGSNTEAAISGGLGAALGAAPAVFPSTLRSKAGAALGNFTKQFGGKTINPTGPMTVVQEAQQAAKAGANLPKVLRDFIQRTTTAFPEAAEPITLKEARLFASNASRQSAADTMSQNPNMQRLVGRFAQEMHNSIGEASGDPNNYFTLLKNYAAAKGYGSTVDAVKGLLLKAVAATGAGAAAHEGYKMVRK